MRLTNLLLYLSFCALLGTGALLQWKLVPGSEGGRGLTVLSLNRHAWGGIHLYLGILFLLSTWTHLLLNWPWLRKIAASGKIRRLMLGLAAGAFLAVGIYALPLKGPQAQEPGTQEYHQDSGGQQLRKGW